MSLTQCFPFHECLCCFVWHDCYAFCVLVILSSRVYHCVSRSFLYHSWSCPSFFAYPNNAYPISITTWATGSVNNLGTPCQLLPLPPFAMLKRLENVLFSVRKASSLYNIERGKGFCPQMCRMSQESLSETATCQSDAWCVHFSSQLWSRRQKLSPQDAGSRLGLGLANTCHRSNCSDCVVPAATALVSGAGFYNVWIFTG